MTRFIRYALATFCFVVSVGCLALWWRSMATWDLLNVSSIVAPGRALNLQSFSGDATIFLVSEQVSSRIGFGIGSRQKWRHKAMSIHLRDEYSPFRGSVRNAFQRTPRGVQFPLWYPALAFALAGIGALRLDRRFTLRSAIIATTVVAGLLGMAVIL